MTMKLKTHRQTKMETTVNLILFDIDGTLANGEQRVHLIKEQGWDAYFEACLGDTPFAHMQVILDALAWRTDVRIVFVSGRPERIRAKTARWLNTHYHIEPPPTGKAELYMRADGDHRPDLVIKVELLERIIYDYGKKPLMVFDDRNQVVNMWREQGIPCLQVAEGRF
jgi:hypothetical protein